MTFNSTVPGSDLEVEGEPIYKRDVLTGAGSPVGVLVPQFLGQLYIRTGLSMPVIFTSVGATNADWQADPSFDVLTFVDGGNVTGNTVIEPPRGANNWNTVMGHDILQDGVIFAAIARYGSFSASAATTLSAEFREETTPSTGIASQHVIGSGALKGSVDLVTVGAVGAMFYLYEVNVFATPPTITAGNMLFCDLTNFAFAALSDLQITVILKYTN